MRRTITIGAVLTAVIASVLAGSAPAQAAPSIPGGSCVSQNGSGVYAAVGPATSTVKEPQSTASPGIETQVACNAPLVQPLSAYAGITSDFGVRIHPITGVRSMHYGTDYSRGGIRGTAILSIAPGTVVSNVESWATSGTGNTVVIAHANGVRSQYMHMNGPSWLGVGAQVGAGQVVGYVGTTGGSTGPHLHLEVRVNNAHVDPAPFLAGAPYLR